MSLRRSSPLKRSQTPLKRTPLRKVSRKQGAKLRLYYAKRKAFLETHVMCEVGRVCCTGRATDLHHAKGRGPYLNDETTFIACCRNCHTWTHANPAIARYLGFLR